MRVRMDGARHPHHHLLFIFCNFCLCLLWMLPFLLVSTPAVVRVCVCVHLFFFFSFVLNRIATPLLSSRVCGEAEKEDVSLT